MVYRRPLNKRPSPIMKSVKNSIYEITPPLKSRFRKTIVSKISKSLKNNGKYRDRQS